MKKYLITSKEFYTDSPAVFHATLKKQLQIHMPKFALLRDKTTSNYEVLACGFVDICQEFGVKSFIHQHVKLAKKLGASGVHLTSGQFEEIARAKSLGLEVIISTHTHEEVLRAEELGANYVTYSPIFASPNKGEPKGIADLKALLGKCAIKVFALGGIVESRHVEMVNEAGAYGFASIRYFYS